MRLHCPNKIKHFLWRACKNILPTNLCLTARKVVSDSSCGFCGGFESSGHALWDCEIAAGVWREIGLKLPKLNQPMKDFTDVVWTLYEKNGVSDWELFVITAWMIWNNKNTFKHEGKCKDPKKIAMEAKEYAKEVAEESLPPTCGTATGRVSWRPPQNGRYKVNVDGAVFSRLKSSGIGIVIRNEDGLIMGAMSKNLPVPLGALEVEAKALEGGIELARDLGLWEVELESDAQVVVKAVMGIEPGPSSIMKVVEGIRMGLSSFKFWSLNHICRKCNNAAHLLARTASSRNETQVWVEDTPPVIANQLSLDVICEDLGPS